jgi:hypothetical protein
MKCCAPSRNKTVAITTVATKRPSIVLPSQQLPSLPAAPQVNLVPVFQKPDRNFNAPAPSRYICGVKGKSAHASRKKRVVGGADALPGEW